MSDKIRAIFDEGIADGKSRDAIIVSMVQAGATLNTAQNHYKDWAKETGLISSRVGHKAEALDFLRNAEPDLIDDDVRADFRKQLTEKFGVTTSTANDYIKAYAEEAGIELPKSQFGGSSEDNEEIYSWIRANPNCSKAEFQQMMKTQFNRSPGSIDETYRGIKLARKLFKDGVTFE